MATYWSKDEGNISRRRAMADMLSKQGRGLQQGLGQTDVVGGYAIPTRGVESANAILSQLLGAYFQRDAGKKEDALNEQKRKDIEEWANALSTVGQPSEVQPVMVGPGPSPERLSPENVQRMEEVNRGAMDIMAEDKTRQQNEIMSHLLTGVDMGGVPAAIAGTQLGSMFGTGERKPVGGLPGVTTDGKGNFYDASGVRLDPTKIAEMDMNRRRASATQVNMGGDDIYGLAQELGETPEYQNAPLEQRMEAAKRLLATGDFGSVPLETGAAAQSGSPLSQAYIKDGVLTPYGASILGIKRDGTITSTGLLNPDNQKKVYDAAANSASVIDDVNLLKQVIAEGGWVGGPLFGNENMQKVFGWLDQLGLGMEQTSEVKAAIRRLQLKGKIDLISQAGGVRAFDSDREMQNLVESLTNEQMDSDTMLESLNILEERARTNLGNFQNIKGFINDTGNQFIYGDVSEPAPYTSKTPTGRVSMQPDGSRIVEYQDADGNLVYERE